MSKIEVLVFIHLLGAFLICGGAGVGMATGIAMPRTDSVRVIKTLSSIAHRTALAASLPGGVLTLVTGVWFIADFAFFELEELWLWMSFVLWTVAAGIDHGVLGPHLLRLHREAARLQADGVETSAELQRLAGSPSAAISGNVLLLVTVAFLVLMVFRPG